MSERSLPAALCAGEGRPAEPFVSVIVPCRNESRHIDECLESILANDYPANLVEVLVVDGASTDDTRERVARWAARHPGVRLLDNPRRIAPTALNIGIAAARGDVVMRMDAHTAYPPHYISRLVGWLCRSGADNVGGVCDTRAATDTPVARAIAAALAHPFGVGNSWFRIGTTVPRWVDTVPFGCFWRDLFDRVGGFDEELARNQDDEFNLRLTRRGGRILLVPDVVAVYYARGSIGSLARMYYQYGVFKPLVARKVGAVLTLRQLVPSMLVIALAVGAIASLLAPRLAALWLGVLAVYGAAVAIAALSVVGRTGPAAGLASVIVFPTLHIAYGGGFLRGAVALLRRRPAIRVETLQLSR